MFKRIAPVVALTMLSGCTLLKGDEYHQATLDAIQQSESTLSNKMTNLELHISNQMDYIDSLESQVVSLKSEVKELKSVAEQTHPVIETPPAEVQAMAVQTKPRHEVVLGEIEKVTIDTLKKNFDARIDTGAATSSLNAVDVEEFERNGKNWVRFHLSDETGAKDDSGWIEAPILRYVRIRQSTSDQSERRAVVELWVKLGDIHEKTQFTLADRSQMSHPILLGREFIRDIAVVDVSRKYIQTETKIK
ncbi:ATP-dependent zinc protease [Vibrio furnissii]|uniref:ATP-dependent zinc protease family protein n=1 Tax=Vibrio furnissii TaxID=29494 RepID=UPI0002F61E6E|nr:ATP-dependent zinc protease [Vibrio furnissii]MCG6212223.1 ATP-dependent zinc protease [Vibrio furnissii]MCG6235677.1 ATP-dependent zinc protease [Vibrio furnissii]MCG6257467.1 ATP-dependent zinc protease [Vibrio furnissii]QDC93329.1 ATP-dependent zinc protease [Vibrio furnissii]TRN26145.1 ATP-dependent Zn protease [Vibrio furnissii]